MANEKILVVDDDTNICELLRLYLTKEGYQVTVANDGEEGLEKFNQVKPDMVLLDVMMPKMDGLEVCRRIRKAGNTPVMMLTAKGETFDKVLGLELGADDYMVKPFDAKEVVARIKAVLRRCTKQMSCHRFGRADRNFCCRIPQCQLDRCRFSGIISMGTCSMCINIIHLLRRNPCLIHC